MKINELINEIKKVYPNVLVGDGKKFSKEKLQEIAEFVAKFDFISKDSTYYKYLTEISGLSIYSEEENEDFTLFGFDGNKTILFEGVKV